MAGKISTFAKNEMIDHVFKAAYTPTATLYFCLCVADPTISGTGASISETDYTGYVRKSFTGSELFAASSARKITQNTLLTLPQATSVSTIDISHWAIVDAATNGNMLAFGAFNSAWNVVSGNIPKIASGQIEISIDATEGGAAGFTTVAADLLLDHVFLNDVWSTPSGDIHFGLSTATISDASTLADITETDAEGYAREPVPAASFDASALVGDAAQNTTNTGVEFDVPTGDSTNDITSLFVCDTLAGTSATTDILIAYDNSNVTDQPFNTDDEVVVEAGSFTATLN
jgi:hypothetical protein